MTVVPTPSVPGMGRSLIDHDDRNRNFPIRALFGAGVPRRNRTWRRGAAYDQGQTSACVGFSFKGILNTQLESAKVPYRIRSKVDAIDFYRGGQRHDEWPGEEPAYEGTSARGVCRYLQSKGLIGSYRWAFGLDDVLDTLSHHGPVAIGVNWYAGMMHTDALGYIYPNGRIIGGHEVEIIGIDVKGEFVVGMNSWGRGWGTRQGRLALRWADLDRLLSEDGDAVTLA